MSTYERYFGRKDCDNPENEEKSILETPPLPDYHHNKKLYCPNCTREHLEMHCKERSNRGAPSSSQAAFKAKAQYVAKVRKVHNASDHNQTRLLAAPAEPVIEEAPAPEAVFRASIQPLAPSEPEKSSPVNIRGGKQFKGVSLLANKIHTEDWRH